MKEIRIPTVIFQRMNIEDVKEYIRTIIVLLYNFMIAETIDSKAFSTKRKKKIINDNGIYLRYKTENES